MQTQALAGFIIWAGKQVEKGERASPRHQQLTRLGHADAVIPGLAQWWRVSSNFLVIQWWLASVISL